MLIEQLTVVAPFPECAVVSWIGSEHRALPHVRRADGEITKRTGQSCQWTPPDPRLAGHRLCLLADQSYAYVPEGAPQRLLLLYARLAGIHG